MALEVGQGPRSPSQHAFSGSSPAGPGTQPSVQELVNRGTVLGARDQILVVGGHIATQDFCRLLFLEGKRSQKKVLYAGARLGQEMVPFRVLARRSVDLRLRLEAGPGLRPQGGAPAFAGP